MDSSLDFYIFTSGTSVGLAKPICLEGIWEVSLCEINVSTISQPCLLCANFIQYSIVNSQLHPVLRKLLPEDHSIEFQREHFFKVQHPNIRSLEFYLLDLQGQPLSLEKLECTLHFRWVGP
jgi:hypothetical protein